MRHAVISPRGDPLPPARLPDRMSVLGLRVGQVVGWQLIIVLTAVALREHGPQRWAIGALALAGCMLTLPRWRHRWAYQWLCAAWRFRRSRRAYQPAAAGQAAASMGPWPGAALPAIDVTSARIRGGATGGVAGDDTGFAVLVGVAPQPGGPPVVDVPIAALARLLDPHDPMVSAVQVVVHADLADGETASGPATAYRRLGYHRVPRSQSTWVVLRHDPASSGIGVGDARDLHASLARALAGRGMRAASSLTDLRLRGQLADASAATKVLTRDLLAPEAVTRGTAPAGFAPLRWRSWQSATRKHITFWLREWPAGGLPALHHALTTVPARGLTTAVILTRADRGRIGLTATIRVAAGPDTKVRRLTRAVTTAATSCGASLVPLNGEHATGVLATLPLGREPTPTGGWLRRHEGGSFSSPLAAVVPVAVGGVVLGSDAARAPVAVPLFTADGGIRAAVIGDAALPGLLALRAVAAGAWLQIVTTRPERWLRLRGAAQLPVERMTVVRPSAPPPPTGTRALPRMLIDDTGSPTSIMGGPWQAVVTVPSVETVTLPADPSAIVLQRATPAVAAATIAALGLPPSAEESLRKIPDGVVAIALPGVIRFAVLAPHESERTMLRESLRTR